MAASVWVSTDFDFMATFLANHQFFSLNVLNSLFYSVRAIVLVKVYITDFFYFLDEIYMVLKENPFFFSISIFLLSVLAL